MKKNLLKLAIVLVCICGAAMIGYRVGTVKSEDLCLQKAMSRKLTDLAAYIEIAKLIKTNQKERAEELLDAHIDVHVSSLVFQVDEKQLEPMRKEILHSINEAKAYRTKWPLH